MLSAPYDRLRVGNSRGSAGPDARRAGSVASFADADCIKEVEAPIRSTTTGSGAISIVRRQRTQSSQFSLCRSFLIDLFSLSHILSLPSLLSLIASSRTTIVRKHWTNQQLRHSTSQTAPPCIFSRLRSKRSAQHYASCRNPISRSRRQ